MRLSLIVLIPALGLSGALPAGAEPPHGTINMFTIGGDGYAVQFWTGTDKVMIARQDQEVGKGDFAADIAASLAEAALASQNMASCTRTAPRRPYAEVPGLWEVSYRC